MEHPIHVAQHSETREIADPRRMITPCSVLLDHSEVNQYLFEMSKRKSQQQEVSDPLSFKKTKSDDPTASTFLDIQPKLEVLDHSNFEEENTPNEFVSFSILKTEIEDNFCIEEQSIDIKDEPLDIEDESDTDEYVESENNDLVQSSASFKNETEIEKFSLSESTLEILNTYDCCDESNEKVNTSNETLKKQSVFNTSEETNIDKYDKLYYHVMKNHTFPRFFPHLSQHFKIIQFDEYIRCNKCWECDLSFPTPVLSRKHFDEFHSFKKLCMLYKCNLCDHHSLKFKSLIDHFNDFHETVIKCESISFQCLECSEQTNTFNDETHSTLISYIIKNLTISRKLNFNQYISRSKIYFQINVQKLDKKTNNDIVYNKTTCKMCKVDFLDEIKFDVHLDNHIDTSFKQCAICLKHTTNIDKYIEHVFRNHANDKDVFEKCEISFKYIPNINANDISNGYHCTMCQFSTFNICQFNLHIVKLHLEQQKRIQYYVNISKTPDTPLLCPICKVSFSDKKLFFAHCLSSNILDICCECNIAFVTREACVQHWNELCHSKDDVKCFGGCNYIIKGITYFQRHLKNNHCKKLVTCFVCRQDTLSSLFLDKSKHEYQCCLKFNTCNNKKVCLICSSQFKSINKLLIHMHTEINGDYFNKYQCKYCLSWFCTKQNLVLHLSFKNCKKVIA